MKQLTEYQQAIVTEHLDLVDIVIRSRIAVTNGTLESYEDFFQIGCEALCRAALTYDPNRSAFKTYASRIIYNAVVDHCRKQNRYKNILCDGLLADRDCRLASPGDCMDAICAKEIYDTLQRARQAYTGVSRLGVEAIEMKGMGATSQEIADRYNTSINNVNAWIFRARKKLKKELNWE